MDNLRSFFLPTTDMVKDLLFFQLLCLQQLLKTWLQLISCFSALSSFTSVRKTSLSTPQLGAEHFILSAARLPSSEKQQVHKPERWKPFCSGYMIRRGLQWGEHVLFLKVTKGRKISGSRVRTGCFSGCLSVCVLSTLDASQSAIKQIGSNDILEGKCSGTPPDKENQPSLLNPSKRISCSLHNLSFTASR